MHQFFLKSYRFFQQNKLPGILLESNGGNYDSQSNQNTQNTSNYQGNNANSNSGSSGNNNNFASQPFNGNDEEEDDLPF